MRNILNNVLTTTVHRTQEIVAAAVVLATAVAMLVRAVPAQAAVTVNVAYSPASQTINQNGTVAMAIQVSGSQQVQGIQLRVTYDGTKLQYQSISYGTAMDYTDPSAGPGGSGASSYFQINQAKLGAAPTPPFTLATITFKALALSGSTTVGYDSANSAAYDTSANASPIASLATATYSFRDGTNPTVGITAPANGAVVSGSTTFSASASDNVSVSKVEFYVDGALKATDTTSPYSTSIDTTTLSNASHSFMAKAYDAAGNAATATVSATVKNGSSSGGTSGSGGSSTKPGTATPTTTAPNTTTTAPTSSTTQQPVTATSAGNGVQTNSTKYSVTSLKDAKTKKSSTSPYAIVAIVVVAAGVLAGGVILRNIIARKREVMRHVAVLPSSVSAYEPHQPPISPTNLPTGTNNVIQPSGPEDPQPPFQPPAGQ